MNSLALLEYKKSSVCALANATKDKMHVIYRRYEGIFESDEVESLVTVYQALYPGVEFEHVPMTHEIFHELQMKPLLLPSPKEAILLLFVPTSLELVVV